MAQNLFDPVPSAVPSSPSQAPTALQPASGQDWSAQPVAGQRGRFDTSLGLLAIIVVIALLGLVIPLT